MRPRPLVLLAAILLLGCAGLYGASPRLRVTGTLGRSMAIGGESTGWAIQIDAPTAVGDRTVTSLQVNASSPETLGTLERLRDRHVRAEGTIVMRHGVETGDQPVLELSSIKEAPGKGASAEGKGSLRLAGSNWLLTDLAGEGVLDTIRVTLSFSSAEKVTGNASCNRFFGPAQISGEHLTLGPLASSRMACPEAILSQETTYLRALSKVQRYEWEAPYLLLSGPDLQRPLRFIAIAKH